MAVTLKLSSNYVNYMLVTKIWNYSNNTRREYGENNTYGRSASDSGWLPLLRLFLCFKNFVLFA